MTSDDLKAARKALGLSLSGLAKALRMGKNGRDTIRAWESGDNERGIPGPAQVAIEALLREKKMRKNAVNALLEAGCSTAETAAISGQSLGMVEHYARARNQDVLGGAAVPRWEAKK